MEMFVLISVSIALGVLFFAIYCDSSKRVKRKFKFNIEDVEWTDTITVIRTISGKLYKISPHEYEKQKRNKVIKINQASINTQYIESTELVYYGSYYFKGKILDVLKDAYGIKVWDSKNNKTYYDEDY